MDWHLWRTKGIGGSDAPIIMGVSPYMSRHALLLQKASRWKYTAKKGFQVAGKSAAAQRGTDLEPVARNLYIALHGRDIAPACVMHNDIDWLRASLDGLTEDFDLSVEIKCINKFAHQTALGGLVPGQYWPQVQHQLATTQHKIMHYWSYSESSMFSPADRHALVVVRPDKDYIAALLDEERGFMNELMEMVKSPPRCGICGGPHVEFGCPEAKEALDAKRLTES